MDINTNSDSICFVDNFPNDAPMFDFFANAIGVLNVLNFVNSLEFQPRWVTDKSNGTGFAEFENSLLKAKR